MEIDGFFRLLQPRLVSPQAGIRSNLYNLSKTRNHESLFHKSGRMKAIREDPRQMAKLIKLVKTGLRHRPGRKIMNVMRKQLC